MSQQTEGSGETEQGRPFPGLAILPDELKITVFSLIRSAKDRGNARLVCRTWNQWIMPKLFEHFTMTLKANPKRNISDLLYSSNSPILHIRKLCLYDNGERSTEFHNNLKLLVGELQKDQLKSLKSNDVIEPSTFVQLLRTQRKLKYLCCYIDMDSFPPDTNLTSWLATHSSWLPSRLTEVEAICVDIGHSVFGYESQLAWSRFIVTNTPKIKNMTICSSVRARRHQNWPSDLFGSSPVSAHSPKIPFLTLTKVSFVRTDFAGESETLLKAIDFPFLEKLEMSNCEDFATFLVDLSNVLVQKKSQLETIFIVFSSLSKKVALLRAVESLLNATSSLTHITFYSGYCGVIDKDCIVRHRESLRLLSLSSSSPAMPQKRHSVNEMREIIDACINLQQLAVDFPDAEFGDLNGGIQWSLTADAKGLSFRAELRHILDVVAKAPNLHTLRILSIGKFREIEDIRPMSLSEANLVRIAHANYANQVLAYLAARGSNIKVLAISPHSSDEETGHPKDLNGHCYPDYYYVRGQVSDCLGRTRVVAEPIEHVLDEMSESTILR